MKKLSCKDINPSSTCDFTATGSSAQTVAKKMLDHAQKEHKADIDKMDMSDGELLDMFESKVHS